MMKKGAIFIASILMILLSTAVFAEVTLNMAEKVTLVFTYTNPDAGEVYLPGSFNGWNTSAQKMEKGENGVFTASVEVKTNEKIQYKFYVDGSWTEDPNAPALTDDGFGGNNGLVDVAAMIAGGGKADASAAGGSGLMMANYIRSFVETSFITNDIKSGVKVDGTPLELDQVRFNTAYYPKVKGTAMPGFDLFIELQVFDGGITFFKSNTEGDKRPFTVWQDGLQLVGQSLFGPFTAVNADQMPALGKLTMTWSFPMIKIETGYKWSKGTLRKWGGYEFIKEQDAGLGYVELSNGKDLKKLGDMGLDVLFALTERRANYGAYSYANIALDDKNNLDLEFQMHSPKNLFNVFKDFGAMNTLGFQSKAVDGLDLKVMALFNYDASGLGSFSKRTKYNVEGIAGRLVADYSSDMFGTGFIVNWSGNGTYIPFGSDGDVKGGKFFAELSPWAKPVALAKFGLVANIEADNFVDEAGVAASYLSISEDMKVYMKPWVDLFLTDDITINAYGKIDLLRKVDKVTAANTVDLGFKFLDAGLKTSVKNVSEALQSITATVDVSTGLGDWDKDKKAFPINYLYNNLLLELGLADNMKVVTAVMYRLNMKTKPAATSDADWKKELSKESPIGFGAGFSWLLPIEELKKPTLAVTCYYDFNPWDVNYKTDIDPDRDDYKYKDVNQGSKTAAFDIGMVWDF